VSAKVTHPSQQSQPQAIARTLAASAVGFAASTRRQQYRPPSRIYFLVAHDIESELFRRLVPVRHSYFASSGETTATRVRSSQTEGVLSHRAAA